MKAEIKNKTAEYLIHYNGWVKTIASYSMSYKKISN